MSYIMSYLLELWFSWLTSDIVLQDSLNLYAVQIHLEGKESKRPEPRGGGSGKDS